jgi:DNA-binding response OmpR family regulator
MAKKVLVIDNDPDILDIVQEILSYSGFQVDTYPGTDNIVQLVLQCKPDLLIMDFLLDGKNGGELCRLIKESPLTSRLPVILYSAYPKVLQTQDQYGCDAFIAKPFDLTDLTAKVTELIESKLETPLSEDFITG